MRKQYWKRVTATQLPRDVGGGRVGRGGRREGRDCWEFLEWGTDNGDQVERCCNTGRIRTLLKGWRSVPRTGGREGGNGGENEGEM